MHTVMIQSHKRLFFQLFKLVPKSAEHYIWLSLSSLNRRAYQKEHIWSFKQLRAMSDIIVLPVDKESGRVVMGRTDYTSKSESILKDKTKCENEICNKDRSPKLEWGFVHIWPLSLRWTLSIQQQFNNSDQFGLHCMMYLNIDKRKLIIRPILSFGNWL